MTGRQTDRRVQLHANTDARVHNTRESLIDAYRSTVSADPESLSVVAICRAAGVARSTFYTHYATIEELAVATIGSALTAPLPIDLRHRAARNQTSADITRSSICRMIADLDSIRMVVLSTIRLASRGAIVQGLIGEMTRAVRTAIDAEASDLPAFDATVTAEFVGAGTVYATLGWLEQDHRDQQAIVDRLMLLMPPVLTRRTLDTTSHEALPTG